MNRYKTVLLFGAPGAGKGTQGAILGQVPGFYHLSSGEVFRNLKKSSPIARTFLEYSNKGELVPDDVTIDLILGHIDEDIEEDRYHPDREVLMLDGIPRNPNQAKLLDPHCEVLAIIHLVCRDLDQMIRRLRGRALKENRPDDAAEEIIRRRFEIYERDTRPVLEHYPRELVHEVDAMNSPAVVLQDTLEVLAPLPAKYLGNPLR